MVEALAAGAPVLATDRGGARDIVRPDEDGVLIEDGPTPATSVPGSVSWPGAPGMPPSSAGAQSASPRSASASVSPRCCAPTAHADVSSGAARRVGRSTAVNWTA